MLKFKIKSSLSIAMSLFIFNSFANQIIAAPVIANITDNRGTYSNNQIPLYEKYEITFDISNSIATNKALPFDANPPSGVQAGEGITVNAEFSQNNFQTKIIVPAFYYQDYDYQVKGGDWLYPKNSFAWKVRYAPSVAGTWQYRLTAQDSSGYVTSSAQTFTTISSNNKGFIKPSSKDTRYFEFENGSYFPGLGYNRNFDQISWSDPVGKNQNNFKVMGENGVQLIRHWLSQWGIWSSNNTLWHSHGRADGSYSNPDDARLKSSVSAPGSDVAMAVETYWGPCMFMGWLQKSPAVKPNQKYQVRLQYLIPENLIAQDTSKPHGLVIKLGGWLWDSGNYCYQSGVGSVISPYKTSSPKDATGKPEWTTMEFDFVTANVNYLPNFYLVLENMNQDKITTAGKFAYIDRVEIKEVMPDGSMGHDINPNSWVAYHKYFNQRQSYAFDKVLELAKQNDIYLQLVVTEKNEYIQNMFDYNGNPATFNNNNYYGNWRNMTMIRWYQQAWWRYLAARWGYSTNIFSFELLNEGDPYNGLHYTLADEFAKYMKQFSVRRPMVSTSFWHSLPVTEFWNNTNYPNVDYADVHSYLSTTSLQASNIKDPVVKSICGTNTTCYLNYMKDDTALYSSEHSLVYKESGLKMPLVRGEAGIDFPGNQTEDPNLVKDLKGVWLHNLIFATLNYGGMYEASYWWGSNHIYKNPGPDGNTANGMHEVFKPLYDFLDNIPMNNGKYGDTQAIVSNQNLRILGQKDVTNNKAHIWIQNRKHIWCAVVIGVSTCPQSSWTGLSSTEKRLNGNVTINGFSANTSLPIEYWQFDENVNLIGVVKTNLSTSSAGTLVLELAIQPSNVVDVAIKIGNYSQSPTSTPAPIVKPGDTDNDNDVDMDDYNNLINNFDENYIPADFNVNGIVDIYDFNILIGNFGK